MLGSSIDIMVTTLLLTLRSDDMGKAYRSQIQFYAQPVENAIQALETQLVAGVEDRSLQVLIDDLGKKIERYNSSIKPVKAAYDS